MIFFPKEKVSVILGSSYHIYVCSVVHISDKFGLNYLFVAIETEWNVVIDSWDWQVIG